jgi:hypothetical protein
MKYLFLLLIITSLIGCSSGDQKTTTGAKDTVAAATDTTAHLTLAQQLTLIDKRKVLPTDSDYVIQVTNQLELLSNKYKEPQDTIAEYTNKVQSLLHSDGIEDYNLNILRELSKLPKLDNTKFKDVATLYAMDIEQKNK